MVEWCNGSSKNIVSPSQGRFSTSFSFDLPKRKLQTISTHRVRACPREHESPLLRQDARLKFWERRESACKISRMRNLILSTRARGKFKTHGALKQFARGEIEEVSCDLPTRLLGRLINQLIANSIFLFAINYILHWRFHLLAPSELLLFATRFWSFVRLLP